ncbi:MAG: SDR family oxidoreductase [Acidobacteria bacterium]|nr:SDR family oxidoreductase [Acidobacteriota bacterium]
MSRLLGKVALVTGAGQGIGRAIAGTFAAEGARVVALDAQATLLERTVGEITGFGSAVESVVADISRREEVRRAVQNCVERCGGLDILVANAGIASMAPFLELDDATWQRMMNVNLTGTFYCMQEAARVMAPKRKGVIVVIASTSAFWVEYHMAHYNASKGGVVALVRSAAIDLAPLGIVVNAIEPGIVNTPQAAVLVQNAIVSPEYLKRIPMGRFQEPEDVARVAVFLASEDATYITGHALIADGGWTLGLPESSIDGRVSVAPAITQSRSEARKASRAALGGVDAI